MSHNDKFKFVIQITDALNMALRQITELETNAVSVGSLMECDEIEQDVSIRFFLLHLRYGS